MIRCSIIIPVYNRAAITGQCLNALLDAPLLDDEAEIIVVDDGSDVPTRYLLASYADRVRVVTHLKNDGFAAACNDGAGVALGEYLVFLNNDILPQPGWLEALVQYAENHSEVAAVGARLLFPDQTIQHAGVTICQDRLPRHLYAGFPADHPAVNKSRRFQAVTAACMLLKRASFEQTGGFDTAFRNGYEDVDLCLRLGEHGSQVHYCHDSVLYHLESVSEGRFDTHNANAQRFLSRWGDRVEPDDLDYYLEDGLLAIAYDRMYPVRIAISPHLAVVDTDARQQQAEKLLVERSRQVLELLKENIRLTVDLGEAELQRPLWNAVAERGDQPPAVPAPPAVDALDHEANLQAVPLDLHDQLARRDDEILKSIHDLQATLATMLHKKGGNGQSEKPTTASKHLRYQQLIRQIRETVQATIPLGATLIVASKGDNNLLKFARRRAWHFPRVESGQYAGYHPADSAEAISHLEAWRAKGGDYLLLPATGFWWLEHYTDFKQHLESRYQLVAREEDVCIIYALHESPGVTRETVGKHHQMRDQLLAQQVREIVHHILPVDATVLVASNGDTDLLNLNGRRTWPFPEHEEAGDACRLPPGSTSAITNLEQLRDRGAEYLVVPHTSFWWLERYEEFRQHLDQLYRELLRQKNVCVIYDLSQRAASGPDGSLYNGG
jgi:GT2 family glycosyltransferase